MKLGIKTPTSMMSKRIPTLVGLGVLVVGLIVGMLVFTQGTGVFSPRATPETTPKKVKVTNVTDNSFTVSFLTDEATPGFLRYGPSATDIRSRASDDRDQLTGTTGDFALHHITVRGLQPNTDYHYLLGTGSGSTFDNEGKPFTITTTSRGSAPSAANTIFGSVASENGAPAEGAIVYLATDGAGEMSTLVKSSGSWAIPLSNARKTDGSDYATITEDQTLKIVVQGEQSSQLLSLETTVSESQPVAALQFGTTPGETSAGDASDATAGTATPPSSDATQSAKTLEDPRILTDITGLDTSSDSAKTAQTETDSTKLADASTTATNSGVVNLEIETHQTVDTSAPVIKGKAAPGITVNIQVNSETQITQTLVAGQDGSFSLDLAALSQNLENGEHTVTYSYVDPTTGQTITKTQTFTVQEPQSDRQQLAQVVPSPSPSPLPSPSPSPTPFGSGNPFPIGGSATGSGTATTSASPTPSPTASASASPSARTSMPSTASGVPVSGSVGATMTLVIGGLFFLIAGAWSFWISSELGRRG